MPHANLARAAACLQARIGRGAGAQRLAAELVAGINHVQYNQGIDINAFAGMVSYCWASAVPQTNEHLCYHASAQCKIAMLH